MKIRFNGPVLGVVLDTKVLALRIALGGIATWVLLPWPKKSKHTDVG